ncbi:MAG: OmpH family outer membrane protein [Pseudomonadota bacterium]
MKKFLLVALASLALVASPALAETTTGVVNIAKIMRDSKAATSVRNQLQAKQKAFQSDLDAKEKSLLAEDQALVKQKDMPDKDAFQKKVTEFRQKAATEQQAVKVKKDQLDKAFGTALEEIQKNVVDVVKQVATEKKLTLVLSSAQVLYTDNSLDLTDEVLKRLDSKLPNVAVKF